MVIFFLVVSVISLLSATLAYKAGKDNMWVDDKKVFLKIATALSKEAEKVFAEMGTNSQVIARHDEVREFMSGRNTSDTMRRQILSTMNYFGTERSASVFSLFNTKGICVLSTDPSFVGNDFSFRNYFKVAMKGGAGTEAAIGTISRRLGYYFAYPVYHPAENRIVGAVVIKTEPDRIHSVVQGGDFGFDTNIMFTNDNGVILDSSKEERVLMSLSPLTTEKLRLEQETRFINRDIKGLSYERASAEIFNYASPTIFDMYDPEDNLNETITVTKVGEYPFYIVTETSTSLMQKHITNQLMQIYINVAIGIMAAMIIFGFLLRILLKNKR